MESPLHLAATVLVATLALFLTGCTVNAVKLAVKDTEGIKLCATEQAKAELVALRLKDRYAAGTTEYKDAERLFDTAATHVSLFYKSVIDEIDFDAKVDVPKDRFLKSDAATKLSEFQTKATALMGSGAVPEPATLTAIATFVADVIKIIQDQNDKAVKEALGRVREALQHKAKPLRFKDLTAATVEGRYVVPRVP